MQELDTYVTGAALEANPDLYGLVVDYLCWAAAVTDWQLRQQRRRLRRQSKAWVAEGQMLFSQLDDMQARARECGLKV